MRGDVSFGFCEFLGVEVGEVHKPGVEGFIAADYEPGCEFLLRAVARVDFESKKIGCRQGTPAHDFGAE